MYMLSLSHHASGQENGDWCLFIFLYIFAQQILAKLKNIFKNKILGIIFTPWAMFVPISTFLIFSVSEVACREQIACFWQFFCKFYHN